MVEPIFHFSVGGGDASSERMYERNVHAANGSALSTASAY